MTAEELAALKRQLLRNDPEYRARVEAAEAERQARVAVLRAAEKRLPASVQDLIDSGYLARGGR